MRHLPLTAALLAANVTVSAAQVAFASAPSVIVAEDFNAPLRGDGAITLVSGNGQSQGGWFTTREGATLRVTLPATLPESFSFEAVLQTDGDVPLNVEMGGGTFRCGMSGVRVQTEDGAGGEDLPEPATHPVRCQLRVDGDEVRAYIDGQALAEIPQGRFSRASVIEIRVPSGTSAPSRLGSLRIAAATPTGGTRSGVLASAPTAGGTAPARPDAPGPITGGALELSRRLDALEAQNRQLQNQVAQLQAELTSERQVVAANFSTVLGVVCQHQAAGDRLARIHQFSGMAVSPSDPRRLMQFGGCHIGTVAP
jgi:hypothetical protein